MGLADWDDWLTRAVVRRPFSDVDGRKGWLEPFCRAPPHAIRRMSFALAGWPRWPRPLRVAFLSDFHVGSHSGDVARLESIVAEAAAWSPDLALFGGDFVNMLAFGGGRVPPRIIAGILGRLAAPLGRMAVIGNHDRDYDAEQVSGALGAQDIAVLTDERRRIAFHGRDFDLIGVPDARRERPAARAIVSALTPDRPSLVLAHDPYWFKYLPPGPHLMLAGHTHGGQISLPLVGPLRNASRAPLRWTYGVIEEEGRRMVVTSGLGASGLPLRLGVAPEYVLLELNGA